MDIQVVLFDADGVIQVPAPDSRRALAETLGHQEAVDEFRGDVFAAERPALTGEADFGEALSQVLSRWRIPASVDEALDLWTTIEVQADMVDAVRSVRRTGVRCYLATNQEPHRARYMSDILGYADLFDGEFYSCRMGLMKPDPEYFRSIMREIAVSPEKALFIDDRHANVDSARGVGLHAAVFSVEAGVSGLERLLHGFGVSVS